MRGNDRYGDMFIREVQHLAIICISAWADWRCLSSVDGNARA